MVNNTLFQFVSLRDIDGIDSELTAIITGTSFHSRRRRWKGRHKASSQNFISHKKSISFFVFSFQYCPGPLSSPDVAGGAPLAGFAPVVLVFGPPPLIGVFYG